MVRHINDFSLTAGPLGWCLLYPCQSLTGFSDWEVKPQPLSSWYGPESGGRENSEISGGVLLFRQKLHLLEFGMRHQSQMLSLTDERLYCKDGLMEKGQKDNALMSYGCAPILFVCFLVPHAASHWLTYTISQRCKWAKAGQKNRRRAALRKSVVLVF